VYGKLNNRESSCNADEALQVALTVAAGLEQAKAPP